ncbi:ATP-binding cassette domain-containing protein [Marinobacter sediminum]|uniref:thiamine ABC transporter ATP-binding protein n=1 Tax=Marinobacter sediminum TaxID=256323 RepID=UPI00202DC1D2|nr:ATP-binding cassette domain-containing protein [Marinobacter sediminum]MCM0612191.1 ATP-binding cassette domain-containing protein [Marinobacter sediminum]
MLDVRNLAFTYEPEREPWCFNFQVKTGECIAINGPSGSGKSTLLGLLAGFLEPSTGEITWNGEPLVPLPPWERPMTSVFQEHNLFEHLDVATNIGLGMHPGMKLTAEQKSAISEGLISVGLAGLAKRMPAELSGGQRQRVALLRAILRNQPLLLLDEPLTGLDEDTRKTLRAMLIEQKGAGVTIILASHDEEDRRVLADSHWNL